MIKDKSELHFLYVIAILIFLSLIGTLFEINYLWILGGLSLVLGVIFSKCRSLIKYYKWNTSVINQIIKKGMV